MPQEIKTELELDLRGKLYPVPKDTVMQNIGSIPVGGVLKATTTDPHSLDCIPTWMNVMGNEVVRIDRGSSEFIFYVKRMK